MTTASPTRGLGGPFAFNRHHLPNPATYYTEQGLRLSGGGEWKNALCPFHQDTKPSLRLRLDSGSFICMACGAKGRDVLAYHMKRHGLSFKQAAQQLGAWEQS
jgi:hypothetical protein